MIQLPEGLSNRAEAVVSQQGVGPETINSLVAEALDQYLGAIEEPSEGIRGPAVRARGVPEPDRDDLLSLNEIELTPRRVFLESMEASEKTEAFLTEALDSTPDHEWESDADHYEAVRDRVLAKTTIGPVGEVVTVEAPDALRSPVDLPLFGLHNRDYPSLWALDLLARATVEGPALWSEFASGLELTSREFGEPLRLLDRIEQTPRGLRYSAAFPDPDKPRKVHAGPWIPSAHDSSSTRRVRLFPFVKNNFARTQTTRNRAGQVEARGPLPRWNAISFVPEGRDYRIGVTSAGADLLRAVEGTSLQLPHPPEIAIEFLAYLRDQSPGDAGGFLRVLSAIADTSGSREDVIDQNLSYFGRILGREGEGQAVTFASTMTQGYVARAREWGLVDPNLDTVDGRKVYRLTAQGTDAISALG